MGRNMFREIFSALSESQICSKFWEVQETELESGLYYWRGDGVSTFGYSALSWRIKIWVWLGVQNCYVQLFEHRISSNSFGDV